MKPDFLTQPHTHLRVPREASRDFKLPGHHGGRWYDGDMPVAIGMAAVIGALAALILAGVIQ